MKTVLFVCFCFLALAPVARGQSPPLGSGLYRSADDFRGHRLTLGVDCKTETHRVRFHEFIGKPYVTIVHGGKTYQMTKDSLFGYRDCDGGDYRFAAGNRHLPILNPSEELLIYKVDQPVAGKNPAREELFFSSSAEAPIQPLTLLGVKKAFPDNHRFHDLLDAQFQNGNLTAFDEMHHMTKINWLLRQSGAVAATH